MKQPKARILSVSTGQPVERVVSTAGQLSMELRVQWFEDFPTDEAGLEWRCDPPEAAEFVGDFEHRKAVLAWTNCKIFVRYFDSNGFWYDTPSVLILTTIAV